MKRRFTKLPIASIAVVVGSLLIGLSLSPAGAQSALTNGQVTVRSDGAVYLIVNGMRRWVATVQITDEELNAYPEAEPIYAGLVPFGSGSASTSSSGPTTTSTSKTGTTTATKTGSGNSTIASKTGSNATTKTGSGNSTIASKNSGAAGEEEEVAEGDVVVNPSSGADKKNPNDPTLAAASSKSDPTGRAEPTDSTTCPASHQVKGGFDKKYYDVDRPQYPTAEVEVCFRTGKDARDAGYTEAKKS
jgi:hypothetical protein